ncbi:MAG: hypothetical protein ACR2JF_17115 [Iamia sp.]
MAVAALWAGLLAVTLAVPLTFMADDALFYVVIGRNVAAGDGITFSQVMPTNGFQPLWQGFVAAATWVASAVGHGSPIGILRATLLLYFAVVGLGVAIFDRVLRRCRSSVLGRVLAALGAVVFLAGPVGVVGSEAALVFVSLGGVLLLVDVLSRAVAVPRVMLIGAGALLGVLMLSRLDTVFVAGAAVLAVAGLGPAPSGVRWVRAATLLVTASVVVGPYLAWNLAEFGRLLPISGAIKLDGLRLQVSPGAIGRSGWALLAIGVTAGAVAFAGSTSRRALVVWAVPLAGAVVASAFYILLSPGGFTDLEWYRVPHLAAALVAVAVAVTRLEASAARPTVGVAALGTSLLLLGTGWVITTRRLEGPNRELFDPLEAFGYASDRALPDGAVVATVDYPGVLGLTDEHPLVALDGLTGDFSFQEDLRDLGAACALSNRGVTHLITITDERLVAIPGEAGAFRQPVGSWLNDRPVGSIRVDEEGLVLDDPRSGLSLWRVDLDCRGR